MLFSSMTFLFVFLPLLLSLYYLCKKELRNYILLAASVCFYAWGEPKYFLVMMLIVMINYINALLIDRYRSRKKLFVTLAILVNFGVLGYFKYTNFLIENLNHIFRNTLDPIHVIMPIGISFYIFQSVSYLMDVYREEIPPQKDFYKLFLFISLFPQMIAGPILKYHDVAQQIDHREFQFEHFVYGVKRFIIGLAKKMLIANVMGAVADRIFEANGFHYPFWMTWVGALAYTFQIYYDFSGYSDMAIGLGAMFGFRFLENFNYPYISRTITEFWRRWHISLSTWFKEYLYIPLGGNRVSKSRNYFNLFVVFLATGIWHGASWNFVVWGLWHGFFIILEKLISLPKKEFRATGKIFCRIYTLLVVVIGWVLFRAETLSDALIYLKRMFCISRKSEVLEDWRMFLSCEEILIFATALLCSMPLFRNIVSCPEEGIPPQIPAGKKIYLLTSGNILIGILFLLAVVKIATSTYNPFIYFRF